jgi:hypothetical protein
LASRNNPTNTGNVVRFVSVGNPPTTPEVLLASEPPERDAIAGRLAMPSADDSTSGITPRWLLLPEDRHAVPSELSGRLPELLLDRNTSATRRVAAAVDRAISQWTDDELTLDGLLSVLGRA